MKRFLILIALMLAVSISNLFASTIIMNLPTDGSTWQIDVPLSGTLVWDTIIVTTDNSTLTEYFSPYIYLIDSGGTDSANDTLIMLMYPLPEKTATVPIWNVTTNRKSKGYRGEDSTYSTAWSGFSWNAPVLFPGFVNSAGTTLDSTIIWAHGDAFRVPTFTIPPSRAWMFVYRTKSLSNATSNGAGMMVFSIAWFRK